MLKNIVYKFTFNDRIVNKTPPYFYIGSKSNCYIKDNLIYDKDNKIYYTSSTYDLKNLIKNTSYILEVLSEFETYTDALNYEHELHVLYDVVNSIEYFNKSLATCNVFTNPDYVTVNDNGNYRRVHKDYAKEHNLKGTTYNMHWFNDGVKNYVKPYSYINTLNKGRINCSFYGVDNPFYNKKHSNETIKRMVANRKKYYDNHPEEFEKLKEFARQNMYKVSQLPKSEKFIKQLKERMANTLYIANIKTGEKKRIPRIEYESYKENGWICAVTYFNNINRESCGNIICDFCGYESLKNNSSFYKWHNERCKHNPKNSDHWTPWEKETDEFKLYIYAKLDTIYDIYNTNKHLSGKRIMPMVLSALGEKFTKKEIEHIKRIYKKIKDGYNPSNSKSYKKYKEEYYDNQ